MSYIETTAKSANSHTARQASTQAAVSIFDCFGLYLGILALIATLAVFFAAAKADAQDLPGQGSGQFATMTTGWWSSSTTSPRFLLSVAGLPDFQALDSVQASTALSGPLGNPENNYAANLTDSEPLPSVSLLSLIQTRYVDWESDLADTRTPTSVNGAMVYPLFQINYGNGSLPVALYNSPRN